MKDYPIDIEQRIYINVYSIAQDAYRFLQYPGFANIFVENANEMDTPLFVCGVGTIIKAGESCGEYHIGQCVAFFGFCKQNISNEIVTSQNCIVYIPKNISLDDAAHCITYLPFINIVKRMSLKLGENVLILGYSEYINKLKYLIELFGCNVINESSTNHIDAVILFGNKSIMDFEKFGCGTKIYLIPDSNSDSDVSLATDTIEIIKDIGKGYYDEDFQLSQIIYPYGYVRDTLKYDAEFCLDIMGKGRLSSITGENGIRNIKEEGNDFNQTIKASVFSYVKKLSELFEKHIEPALLQITCFCDRADISNIEHSLVEATYIINSRVAHIEFSGDIEQNHSVSFTFEDGCVAVINVITGFSELNKKYELNWDGQSASYKSDGKIMFYSSSIKEVSIDSNVNIEVDLKYAENIHIWKQFYKNKKYLYETIK
ncbi:hypothetical protein EHE19_018505 [Ruminiclostridium herbifermentans]|uniref:Uncharacterized protein n=1 Tax=Ruminiclostridium herbifermentans TaxID=2488810 RepID=A0A4U7J9Z4_9FIRM|nr:hypothetical protein [Ruminiclostridium herbifermentans]QNU66798.1 hypothetical protein EHE19_018505 [Ruminiclostridium herbifermentans]